MPEGLPGGGGGMGGFGIDRYIIPSAGLLLHKDIYHPRVNEKLQVVGKRS